jgi:hypothetical protein
MTENHDEPRAEPLSGELHAANLRRRDNIPGNADDKQIAQALVEHDFCRHAGIGTSKDDREGLLVRHQLGAPTGTGQPIDVPPA